jgi:hypothetical protein
VHLTPPQLARKSATRDSVLAEKGLAEVQKEIEALPDIGKRPLSEAAPKVYEDDVNVSTFALQIRASRCFATDDPRLKGN